MQNATKPAFMEGAALILAACQFRRSPCKCSPRVVALLPHSAYFCPSLSSLSRPILTTFPAFLPTFFPDAVGA